MTKTKELIDDVLNADRIKGTRSSLHIKSATKKLAKLAQKEVALHDELVNALKLMDAHYEDLGKSNPGFMGKLTLQDYGLWNDALMAMGKVMAKIKKGGL